MARKRELLPVKQPASIDALRAAQSIVFPDIWAQSMRLAVDGHQFDVKGREYVVPIMRDESPWIIMPKGAQMGATITFITRSLHWITQRRWHHLYLLPLKAGSVGFVQGRIDPILRSNANLSKQFQSVANRMHKQTADPAINLFIRGTNVVTELREVPTDVIILDERDKMVEDNLPEAFARMSGSRVKRVVELSTPTAPGHGVDAEDAWHASDQHRWWVPCPHCSRTQVFNFDENLRPWMGETADDCELHCKHCKKNITDDERATLNSLGRWEPDHLQGIKRGYHINQLNSPTMSIPEIMENYFVGEKEPKKRKAFFNNNLGLPFVAHGDQITPEILDKCVAGGKRMGGIPNGPLHIGVDVGHKVVHLVAFDLDRFGRKILWDAKILRNVIGERSVDDYLEGLANFTCVIDGDPARREVEQLCLKYHGRVWMGFEKDTTTQPETAMFSPIRHEQVPKVNIERTMALDAVIEDYLKGRIVLPADAKEIGELLPNLPYNGFYHQQCQMVREEQEDSRGGTIARWIANKNPDHWHHAVMFARVATMSDAPLLVNENYQKMFAASGGLI